MSATDPDSDRFSSESVFSLRSQHEDGLPSSATGNRADAAEIGDGTNRVSWLGPMSSTQRVNKPEFNRAMLPVYDEPYPGVTYTGDVVDDSEHGAVLSSHLLQLACSSVPQAPRMVEEVLSRSEQIPSYDGRSIRRLHSSLSATGMFKVSACALTGIAKPTPRRGSSDTALSSDDNLPLHQSAAPIPTRLQLGAHHESELSNWLSLSSSIARVSSTSTVDSAASLPADRSVGGRSRRGLSRSTTGSAEVDSAVVAPLHAGASLKDVWDWLPISAATRPDSTPVSAQYMPSRPGMDGRGACTARKGRGRITADTKESGDDSDISELTMRGLQLYVNVNEPPLSPVTSVELDLASEAATPGQSEQSGIETSTLGSGAYLQLEQ